MIESLLWLLNKNRKSPESVNSGPKPDTQNFSHLLMISFYLDISINSHDLGKIYSTQTHTHNFFSNLPK